MSKISKWIDERNDKIYACMEYVGTYGKRVQVKRTAKTRKQANDILDDLLKTLYTSSSTTKDKTDFKDLVEFYRKHYVKPAEFANGRKVSGMKSHDNVESFLKPLKLFFGDIRLPAISYELLAEYKQSRMQQKVYFKKKRP
jgi:hypothetical protein